MSDLKMMLQNLRDKSKCCKKDDFTGERYTIIYDMSIETLNMICEDGIEQLENAQTVNRWIPCSERLPEKHVEVLAYSPYWGKIVVAMWGGEFWLEQWTDDDLEQSEITHWMPLPEPPEGGADDAT